MMQVLLVKSPEMRGVERCLASRPYSCGATALLFGNMPA